MENFDYAEYSGEASEESVESVYGENFDSMLNEFITDANNTIQANK